jgi:hypothetical protein
MLMLAPFQTIFIHFHDEEPTGQQAQEMPLLPGQAVRDCGPFLSQRNWRHYTEKLKLGNQSERFDEVRTRLVDENVAKETHLAISASIIQMSATTGARSSSTCSSLLS